ncbi:hypothetical protein [Halodesulfovibrio aestuarii]|uniref:hypothetical protein n=1 Tax=Halodesulfovibrio aestuarii TaxID=126333 RepID=UPI0003FA5429
MFQWLTLIAAYSLGLFFVIRLKHKTPSKEIAREFLITVSLSFIASYIFYLSNIYLPKIEQQKNDAYFIAATLHNIRMHSLRSVITLKCNIIAELKSNPKASIDEVFIPNTYIFAIDKEYMLRSHYQCTLLMAAESPIQVLLTKHLGGVFKPEKLDDFNCRDLMLHYKNMNNAIENILYELKKQQYNDLFAAEILKRFPKRTCGFEYAISQDYQGVFLSLLPKEEAEKFKKISKQFVKINFVIN